MITGLLTAMASNVALGWIGRRVFDWGGWIATFLGGAIGFYFSLSPHNQDVVMQVLSGNLANVTVGSVWGLIIVGITTWRSWRATVKPQVVTNTGKKVELPVLTEEDAKDMVERNTGVRPTHIPSRVK